jgi:hypothetical protein
MAAKNSSLFVCVYGVCMVCDVGMWRGAWCGGWDVLR